MRNISSYPLGKCQLGPHSAGVITITGRLSSPEPDLQNIPIRTPEGKRIRKAFVALPGRRMVAIDYSQIELRILASLVVAPLVRVVV